MSAGLLNLPLGFGWRVAVRPLEREHHGGGLARGGDVDGVRGGRDGLATVAIAVWGEPLKPDQQTLWF